MLHGRRSVGRTWGTRHVHMRLWRGPHKDGIGFWVVCRRRLHLRSLENLRQRKVDGRSRSYCSSHHRPWSLCCRRARLGDQLSISPSLLTGYDGRSRHQYCRCICIQRSQRRDFNITGRSIRVVRKVVGGLGVVGDLLGDVAEGYRLAGVVGIAFSRPSCDWRRSNSGGRRPLLLAWRGFEAHSGLRSAAGHEGLRGHVSNVVGLQLDMPILR